MISLAVVDQIEMPIPTTQSRITLRERPTGDIDPSLNGKGTFNLEQNVTIFPTGEGLKDGQLLVKVEWISLDPAMRGWLNDSRSYLPPVAIGAVMRSGCVGVVVEVGKPIAGAGKTFRKGDYVNGTLGWQEYAVVPAREVVKINVTDKLTPSIYLGALGMPAQTAYWGMLDVAKIKKGDVVVVSGAAGAVGSVACQIAKIKGCKVIAIAGGAEKCAWLVNELGVDVALDYKSPTFKADFRKIGYLDVYFDNVGGAILDQMLTRLKQQARIVICGAISAYNTGTPRGLQNYLNLISQRASITGFIVFDYAPRYKEAEKQLIEWIEEGRLKIRETQLEGLESCPTGLVGLFKGENIGKMVVKVSGAGVKL